MEEQAILAFGTLILVSCGAGLVFIHSSNPLLKGLNWMGCALLMGGAATALWVLGTSFPAFRRWGIFVACLPLCVATGPTNT